MRPLDRRVRVFQETEGFGVAGFRLIASTCIPQEPADLAADTGRDCMIAGAHRGAKHLVIMILRRLAPADRATQIGDALAERELLGSLLVSLPQSGESSLIMTNGI